MISSVDDIKQLGTIFCIFAHPDDETFTMGGIIAAARRNSQRVIVVTATRGEGGVQDESRWPRDKMAEIRTKELDEALSILGVEHHFFLDIVDGTCKDIQAEEPINRIAKLLKTYTPDSIMTFGPDGLTGHPDHCTVSKWAEEAKQIYGEQIPIYHAVLTENQYENSKSVDRELDFFFNTPKPPTIVESEAAILLTLDEELLNIKTNALKVMPSQYQIMFEKFDEQILRNFFNVEAFVESR